MLPRDSSWLSTNHHRPPRFEQLADAEHVVWLIRQTPAVDTAAGLAVQRLKVAGRIGAIF